MPRTSNLPVEDRMLVGSRTCRALEQWGITPKEFQKAYDALPKGRGAASRGPSLPPRPRGRPSVTNLRNENERLREILERQNERKQQAKAVQTRRAGRTARKAGRRRLAEASA